jgi:hypothetical protein
MADTMDQLTAEQLAMMPDNAIRYEVAYSLTVGRILRMHTNESNQECDSLLNLSFVRIRVIRG